MTLPYKSFAGSLAAVSVFTVAAGAFAQSSSSSIPGAGLAGRELPAPTQQCAQAMLDLANVQLAHFDERKMDEKARIQAHIDALKVVAALSDDAARADAFRDMHETMKEEKKPEMSADVTATMDAVKAACGDIMMFHHRGPGHMGMMGSPHMKIMKFRGPHGPDMVLEKFGMTPEELKAALESGKTIEDIAAEKGIELPAKRMKFLKRFDGGTETEDVFFEVVPAPNAGSSAQ